MEYFASVSQKAFHDWQVELMIQSFKEHKFENKLNIAGADVSENRYEFLSNILNQEKFFSHQSMGLRRGFQPLDEIYSLAFCLETKRIGSSFCVMQPHIVLKNPKKLENFHTDIPSATVAIDPFFTFDHAEKNAGKFWEQQANSRDFYLKNWLPIGSILLLNNLPDRLVQRAVVVAEQIVLNQIIQKLPIWKDTIRLAWVISIVDYLGIIAIKGSYDLVSTMTDGNSTPFVDYNDGIPPVFNKSMFSFTPPFCMSFGDPIEILATCKMSPNANYVSELAEKLLKLRIKLEPTP